MTRRAEVRSLSALLILLVALYVGSSIHDRSSKSDRREVGALIPAGRAGAVASIEVGGSLSSGDVALRLANGRWTAVRGGASYPADQRRVERFLDLLSSRAEYPEVSGGEAARASLGLSSGSAGRVVCFDAAGNRLLDLYVGAESASGDRVFLRRSGSESAFAGPPELRYFTEGDPASWFDLALFPPDFGSKDVERLRFGGPGSGGVFELYLNESGEWRGSGSAGVDVDAGKVAAYAKKLLSFSATDFVSSAGVRRGFRAELEVAVEFGDGSSCSLRVGPRLPDGTIVAMSSATPYAFVVDERMVAALFPGLAAFERR